MAALGSRVMMRSWTRGIAAATAAISMSLVAVTALATDVGSKGGPPTKTSAGRALPRGTAPAVGVDEEVTTGLVAPPSSTVSELLSGMPPPHAVIPLTLADGAELTSATVERVAAGERSRAALRGAFSVVPAGNALEISVNFGAVRKPGTYTLSVLLVGKVKSKPARQAVEIPLLLPPVTLHAIPALTLTVERWPWGKGPGVEPVRWNMTVRETTGDARVSGLTVSQDQAATNDTAPVSDRLDLEPGVTIWPVLDAGQVRSVSLVENGFPVGTTRGQIAIDADQLEHPVIVPFEIRTRVFDWLIIPWFLVFGLAGWEVRHRLRDAEARAELRAKLEPLKARARQLLASSPAESADVDTDPADADMQTKNAELRGKLSDIDAALDDDDPAVLTAAVEGLRDALVKATSARTQVTVEQSKKIGTLKHAVAPLWDLPDAEALARARESAVEAQSALFKDDLITARKRTAAAVAAVDEVGEAVSAWAKDASDAVADATREPKGGEVALPSETRAAATALATAVSDKLKAAAGYDRTSPPASLEAFLRNAHEARRELRRNVQLFVRAAQTEVKTTVDAAALLKKSKPGAEELKEPTNIAAPPADDPVETLKAVTLAVREFGAGLERMLKSVGASAEPMGKLKKGQYADAVAMYLELAGEADKSREISRLDKSRVLPSSPPPPERPLEPQPPEMVVLSQPPAVDPVVLARDELHQIQRIRGGVAAAILSIVTWVAYRAAWNGTLNDFAAVAAVAFFTDFTLDAVVAALTPLKKAPA
jgi:hypothetical protein